MGRYDIAHGREVVEEVIKDELMKSEGRLLLASYACVVTHA